MSAKPKKRPSSKKSDLKTAIIFILFVLVGVAVFLIIDAKKSQQHGKSIPSKSKKAQTKSVAVTPIKTKPLPPVAPKATALPIITPKNSDILFDAKIPEGNSSQIAFVIDDWGYTTQNCQILKEIDVPIAVAILPNLRRTKEVAECAHDAGKLVMLHLPMEPYKNGDMYPDNYIITGTMKPSLVLKLMTESIDNLNHIEGVNNHMGSKAMEDKRLLNLIFRQLKRKDLFFVDSMTSPKHSVGQEVSSAVGIKFAARDVFLDNVNTKEEITKQIVTLAKKAKQNGQAIAIGHDRVLTMKVIKDLVPKLKARGYKIVSIKELVRKQ